MSSEMAGNAMKGKRVGVLMGGISSEREVSLNTGAFVLKALQARGHRAEGIEWKEGSDLTELLRRSGAEVIWLALHGTFGEDGCVQGLLETLKIPYTGSGVAASAAAMEKTISKKIFERDGIPTPPWIAPGDASEAAAAARGLGYPVVVKPSREGSTVGVTIVESETELPAALETAARCHGVTMLERYIPGHECSVGVLDDEALGSVDIRPKSGFYDYKAKYLSGDTEYIVPAPFDPAVERNMRTAGLAAHRALGCSGHSRVDMRVTDDGEVWVLEVNTLPGMTERSLLPKIARHAGLDYETLVERILASATLRA